MGFIARLAPQPFIIFVPMPITLSGATHQLPNLFASEVSSATSVRRNLKRYLQLHPECVVLPDKHGNSPHRARSWSAAISVRNGPSQRVIEQSIQHLLPGFSEDMLKKALSLPTDLARDSRATVALRPTAQETAQPAASQGDQTPRIDIAPSDGLLMSPPSPLFFSCATPDFEAEFDALDSQ